MSYLHCFCSQQEKVEERVSFRLIDAVLSMKLTSALIKLRSFISPAEPACMVSWLPKFNRSARVREAPEVKNLAQIIREHIADNANASNSQTQHYYILTASAFIVSQRRCRAGYSYIQNESITICNQVYIVLHNYI